MERITTHRPNTAGYAILLTNDSAYWESPRHFGTVDAAIRLPEGRMLEGRLASPPAAGAGTTQGREAPLVLMPEYSLHWRDYSTVTAGSYGTFRYLLLTVTSPDRRPTAP